MVDQNSRATVYNKPTAHTSGNEAHAADVLDTGLRRYMLGIYNYMASALTLTGIVAYALGTYLVEVVPPEVLDPLGYAFGQPVKWLIILAPLGFILFLSFGINRMKMGTLQAVFWGFAIAMGLSLSSITLLYTGASIARVFFITAGTFAAMSLYGYTTKRDLSGLGAFLIMGLIGFIIASLVNLFIQSTVMHFVLSIIGVLIFVGLTAYDTQKLKNMYMEVDDHDTMTRKMIMGATTLYLDFINLFLLLLRLFGERR